MRVLVLSYYFEPDLSAGSFRASSLVRSLTRKIAGSDNLDVITTQPNRYHSYYATAPASESLDDRVVVLRVALPTLRGGLLSQVMAFLIYAINVVWSLRGKQYDIVFATSSRLMTAVLGALISRWKGAALYLDIRDIFVDTIQDVFPKRAIKVLGPVFQVMEQYAVTRASRINFVSEGFCTYFEQKYPGKKFSYIPNGIDEEFIGVDFSKSGDSKGPCIVLYAGNIGEGQGLDRVIPALAEHYQSTHEFWIVGDGGLRAKLEQSVAELKNVKIRPPVSRDELIELYRQSDILFVHLNDYPAFRKVLPSKLFEYAATGKPILAGVAGYAADFVSQIPNAAVFSPCDASGAVSAMESLSRELATRQTFINQYRRTRLMDALAADILASGRV